MSDRGERRDYRREPARRPPPRRRPPVRRSGRGFGWLLLLAAVAVVAIFVATSSVFGRNDDTATPTATTVEAPPVSVTFPEGLRREDMAKILGEKTQLSPDEYLAATAVGPRGQRLANSDQPKSLEGFLFPATYQVGSKTTVADLVDAQVAAYGDREAQVNYSYAKKRNLTRLDVLIVAAMVEREVQEPTERPIVAGVIYNRLRQQMRLDIDATVQYALGFWKPELTATDLQIDSPYNTRRFPGLPPGPIANPGLDSIKAAARPVESDYLFYVARADGTGRHYFATTSAEFEAAIAKSRANAGG